MNTTNTTHWFINKKKASSTINNQIKQSTIDELTTPLLTSFNTMPRNCQYTIVSRPLTTMPQVFPPHTTPIIFSAPPQMHLNPPILTPHLDTNSIATIVVSLHAFTAGVAVYPTSQPFQPPLHHNHLPHYLHHDHISLSSPTHPYSP